MSFRVLLVLLVATCLASLADPVVFGIRSSGYPVTDGAVVTWDGTSGFVVNTGATGRAIDLSGCSEVRLPSDQTYIGSNLVTESDVVEWYTLYEQVTNNTANISENAADIVVNRDLIASLAAWQMYLHDAVLWDFGPGWSDWFEDSTGINAGAGSNMTYSASADRYAWTFVADIGSTSVPSSYLYGHYLCNDNAANSNVVRSAGVPDAKFKDTDGYENTSARTTAGKINAALVTVVDDAIGNGDWIGTMTNYNSVLKTNTTICFWFKPTDAVISYVNTIIDAYDADSSLNLCVNGNPAQGSGKLYASFRAGGVGMAATAYTANRIFADDAPYAWTHLALVLDFSAKMLRLYTNGVALVMAAAPANGSYSTVTQSSYDCSGTWGIAFSAAINSVAGGAQLRPIGAAYDDIRIYRKALTSAELKSVMADGAGTELDDTPPSAVIPGTGKAAQLVSTASPGPSYSEARMYAYVSNSIPGTMQFFASANAGSTWRQFPLVDTGLDFGGYSQFSGGTNFVAPGTNIVMKMRATMGTGTNGAIKGWQIMCK